MRRVIWGKLILEREGFPLKIRAQQLNQALEYDNFSLVYGDVL